ncbi:alpha/beta hydrolase [Xylocopilactobacillus apis]|uniref:Alpha/beta hydrolase n=1 Tax=Xylocopilactobacillus apis TaxID=2932183 RepID=A0AAU9CXN0_9LACO|nr:alpha/beta hydrolase [Xylocopilactobacillus apis]BDR56023.1 alpha/beta hydrolase [Xylocopilactobacillus apis]
MKKSKKRRILIIIAAVLFVLVVGLGFASNYMFNYAFVREDKSFIKSGSSQALKKDQAWLKKYPKQIWYEQSAQGKLKLEAAFVPAAKQTNKTIVVFHGYTKNKEHMADYIRMFHNNGYNVLAPDARASGASEGKIIGYGWPDHYDDLLWIKRLIKKTGKSNAQIGLFGVSMGGATVMFLAGEKLPRQVKVLIEDCGYSSINSELSYQLNQMFHLPSFPLIPSVNLETRLRGGYNFNDGDSIAQLKKNKLPILFIHGSKDTFVPTKMVYDNYQATSAPKQLLVVKGASHAGSFEKKRIKYQKTVVNFLNKYLP